MVMGNGNDVEEIRVTHEPATLEPSPEHAEPTPVERAEMRSQNADTRLKTL